MINPNIGFRPAVLVPPVMPADVLLTDQDNNMRAITFEQDEPVNTDPFSHLLSRASDTEHLVTREKEITHTGEHAASINGSAYDDEGAGNYSYENLLRLDADCKHVRSELNLAIFMQDTKTINSWLNGLNEMEYHWLSAEGFGLELIHRAMVTKNMDIVHYLLQHPHFPLNESSTFYEENAFETTLMNLIEYTPEKKTDEENEQVRHQADRAGSLLLQKGVRFDTSQPIKSKYSCGSSWIEQAISASRTRTALAMVKNEQFEPKVSDLATAIIRQEAKVVTALIKSKKIDLNEQLSYIGSSPLFLSISCSREEDYPFANELIRAGTDVNLQDKYGLGILHELVNNRNLQGIKFLLRQPGINVSLRNKYKETPLTISREICFFPATDLFKAAGGKDPYFWFREHRLGDWLRVTRHALFGSKETLD